MATNNAINIPTEATGKVLQGAGVGAALAFSTATYPSTSGTSGNVLTSDGTNWTSAAASTGAMTLISSTDATNQTTVVFTSGLTSSYKYFKVVISGLQVTAAGGVTFILRCSTDGGANYDSGNNYAYSNNHLESNGSTNWNRSSATSSMQVMQGPDTSANTTNNGAIEINLYNLPSAALYKLFCGDAVISYTTSLAIEEFAGSYNSATAVNAIQFSLSSGGNIVAGKFSLFGIT